MRIALINVPLREPSNPQEWIPLPPKGYGGIQWVVTNLLEGYLDLGHYVWLLGAPSTQLNHSRLEVVPAAEPQEIADWLVKNISHLKIDIIHDHSNGVFRKVKLEINCPIVATHHLTGKPYTTDFTVYLSQAQKNQAHDSISPVIRIPVNTKHYIYSQTKQNYLLYLGRVSRWKGVYEAAQFAHFVGLSLIIAGPTWEEEYRQKIVRDFSSHVQFIGEVGGEKRQKLLSEARAVMALSQTILGPWDDVWVEPGSTIVSESAVSGTPVIATNNGCLREIVPFVGINLEENELNEPLICKKALSKLPVSSTVFQQAVHEWHYLKIAAQYLRFFKEIKGAALTDGGFMINPYVGIKEKLLVNGGAVAASVLSPEELSKLDGLIQKLLQNWLKEKAQDPDYWWYRDEGQKRDILYRIHRLETKDPYFSAFIENPNIKQLRDFIFGKPTKATAFALIYKDPLGSGPVKWHRDPIQVPPNTVYNFSFYLDPSDKGNGGLEIIPGSHLNKDQEFGENPQGAEILAAQPGDVIIHDVCAYHGSKGSTNGRQRRSIVIEFQPEDHESKQGKKV